MFSKIISQVEKVTFSAKYFSSDFIFLFGLFVLFVALTLYFRKGRVVSFILAFYPATLLFQIFPFMSRTVILHGDKFVLLNKIGVFLLFLVPIFIIINKYMFSESDYTGSLRIFMLGGISLSATIMIILFSYTTINFDILHDFSPKIDALFTGSKLFYWNLLSFSLIAIF